MKVKELRPNKYNPRKISGERLEMLKESIQVFGDLSGIVYNRRTKNIVSGHQRIKTIDPETKISIEMRYDPPTNTFTVAEGYIEVNGERMKYREVDADEKWEAEALLAANKHGGEWDNDLVQVIFADYPHLNKRLAGFEISKPNVSVAPVSYQDIQVQADSPFDDEEEESDEEYIKNTPETFEQIHTENIPSMVNDSVNAFDSIEEKTEVEGKRFVIIVDCGNYETKQDLKEKLRPLIEEAGAKIF